MFFLREATLSDLNACFRLAVKSSSGIYNLPKDKELLEIMLADAEESFKKKVHQPDNELYIFCLEHQGKIVGTSMIRSRFPNFHPIPYFVRFNSNNADFIELKLETEGVTELCGLYLEPEERTQGLGKLLSFGRFMYMSQYPERFTRKVFAEIRGYVDESGRSPFWDAVMEPFFKMPFDDGIELFVKDTDNFNDKIPPAPIYYDLLPKEVQEWFGKCHPKSLPAFNLLEKQGFHQTDLVQPLDGGPRIEAKISDIQTIVDSSVHQIIDVDENINSQTYLISTHQKPFRAIFGQLEQRKDGIVVNAQTLHLLQLQKGDLCRVAPMK